MFDAEGIERNPEIAEKFWDIVTEQDIHWLFMMGILGEKLGEEEHSVSVKKIFDWNSPEYELDFPDPPEIY